jgi:hypothetical protein
MMMKVKAGVTVEAGQLVTSAHVDLSDQRIPDYEREVVSPKAAELRRVQVGDVYEVRPDVCGWHRGPRRVVRLFDAPTGTFADCEQSELIPLRADGTADPNIWTLVRAARPKAAVGQRWRYRMPTPAWAGEYSVASVDGHRAILRCVGGPALYDMSCGVVDGTLCDRAWEYVGEGEPAACGAPYPNGKACILPPWHAGCHAQVVNGYSMGWDDASIGGVPLPLGLVAAYRFRAEDVASAQAHVVSLAAAALLAKDNLRRTAAAFAFLAAPEMVVHLRRVAVDNAIAACPADLDPVGWRAAVLAWVDGPLYEPHEAVTPSRLARVARWVREPDGACRIAEAYHRATAPRPRVRRRGEAL